MSPSTYACTRSHVRFFSALQIFGFSTLLPAASSCPLLLLKVSDASFLYCLAATTNFMYKNAGFRALHTVGQSLCCTWWQPWLSLPNLNIQWSSTSAISVAGCRTCTSAAMKCWNKSRKTSLCSSPTSGSEPISVRHCSAKFRKGGWGKRPSNISRRFVLKMNSTGIHVKYTCNISQARMMPWEGYELQRNCCTADVIWCFRGHKAWLLSLVQQPWDALMR